MPCPAATLTSSEQDMSQSLAIQQHPCFWLAQHGQLSPASLRAHTLSRQVWLLRGAHLCDALCYSPAGALLESGQARLLPLLQCCVQRLQLALVPAAQRAACLSLGHSTERGLPQTAHSCIR